jgi:hypothetical protein
MKLEAEIDVKERAEWHLISRIEAIKRRTIEVQEGALEAIVSEEAVDDIIKSYNRELRMFEYLKNLIK